MTPGGRNPTTWDYGTCPLDTAPACFGPFAEVVGLWRQKWPAAGRPPSRRAFDFQHFRPWMGRVAIARIDRDPFDLRFVLWGTQLSFWWGLDYTGKTLGEGAQDPQAWKDTEGRYFRAMDREPFIGVAWGGLDHYRRPDLRIMSVDLPLWEGGGLSHVLMIHREIGPVDAPATVMPDAPLTHVES